MPYLVTYEADEKELATCVSDERAALRLAASFEAQGLTGVAIQDPGTGEVFSPLAFRLRSGQGAGENKALS
ncbi:hypothetical protein [Brevundimonas naejangsanensis]|uniref:hypothetical protein n=1 Tax=Brevundimonas naejangsanensis TaxID=588932 RepID=UPI001068FC88|nr:hypothetical protein [Brevundimonas naejangsanensis]QBQ47298.1 hypothetical protein E3U41_00545 [Brevundimonas naejangsanensis]